MNDIRINNVRKRTAPNRLQQAEAAIANALSGAEKVSFLDVGASDGVNSRDLLLHLQNRGFTGLELVHSDRYLKLQVYGSGAVREYRAIDSSAVMLRIGRLGIRLPKSEHCLGWISNLLEQAVHNL